MNEELGFDTIPLESSVDEVYMIENQREWKHKRLARFQYLFFSISLLTSILLVSVGRIRLTDIIKEKVGTGPDLVTEIARVILIISLTILLIPVLNCISCGFSQLVLSWTSHGFSQNFSHPSLYALQRYCILHPIMVLGLLIMNVLVRYGMQGPIIELISAFMFVTERICTALLKIGVFLGLEQVLVEKMKMGVHRISLLPKIQSMNAMFSLLSRCYRRFAENTIHHHKSKKPNEDIEKFANALFGDQNELKLEDLSIIVGENDSNELLNWLGESKTFLNKKVVLSKLNKLQSERRQAWKQLQRNNSNINKLHIILQFVFFIIGTCYAAPTLGFAAHRTWMIDVIAIAALGVILVC